MAPMMGWTDRHFRYLLRLVAPEVMVYRPILSPEAVLRGRRPGLLGFSEQEHPIGCQLGGNEPGELALAAEVVQDWGYDEVNFNLGCPSRKAVRRRFGAALLREVSLAADCVKAMQGSVHIPVTVKLRTGVDRLESLEFLLTTVSLLADAGCEVFVIHARSAVLGGLNTRENRRIPPLRYEWVYEVKRQMPELCIILNGGVGSLEEIRTHLLKVDGVMIGRKAYLDPMWFSRVVARLFGTPLVSRRRVLERYCVYIEKQLALGVEPSLVLRHLTGFFKGVRGAARWRAGVAEIARDKTEITRRLLKLVDELEASL